MRLVKNRTETLSVEGVGELLELIKASENAHSAFIKRGERSDQFFKGKQWDDETDDENRAVVNLSYALIQSLVPMLLFKEPSIKTTARTPIDEGKEQVWANIANNTLPRLKFGRQAEKQVKSALMAGEGWMKLYYQQKEDDLEKKGTGTGGPMTEAMPQLTPWSDKSVPVWIHIPWKNVIVDEQSSDRSLEKARFVAIKYCKDPDELRNDPRYKNIPQEFDVNNKIEKTPLNGLTTSAFKKERFLVTIYEVWVYQLVGLKLYKQMVVVMPGVDKPIREPEPWEEYVGADPDWPFDRLVFNEPLEGPPINEIEAANDLQLFFNWAFSTVLNHLELQTDVVAANTGFLTDAPKAMKELQEGGRSRIVVAVNQPGALERLATPRASPDAYNTLSIVDNYFTRVTGISEAAQGGSKSVRTASEVGVVAQGMQLKIDAKAARVADSLKSMIEKWMRLTRQVIAQSGDRRYVMRMAGDTGTVRWFEFDPADLDWEPDVEIEVGSFRQAVMADELQRWTAAFNMAIQLIPILGPGIKIDRMVYEAFKRLGLPAGQLITSASDENMLGMADIVFIMAGVPVQPDPQANPAARMQVIDFFLNSPAAQVTAERNPQALQDIRALRQAYQEILLQSQQAATSMRPAPGSNPLDTQVMSQANQSRSRSAREREAVQPQQGNAGQLAG